MEKTLFVINGGLTDRGNLKAQVREDVKEKGVAKYLADFEKTAKGEYVLAVADVDGKTLYLRVNMTATIADNLFDAPKTSKKVKTAVETVEIGDIFG